MRKKEEWMSTLGRSFAPVKRDLPSPRNDEDLCAAPCDLLLCNPEIRLLAPLSDGIDRRVLRVFDANKGDGSVRKALKTSVTKGKGMLCSCNEIEGSRGSHL